MRKILFIFILGIFLVGAVYSSGISICIDHISPNSPPNFQVSGAVHNVQLSWQSSIDQPSCSGIKQYNIYKDNVFITSTNSLTYTNNNVDYGTYNYSVTSVDLAGHESEKSSQEITLCQDSSSSSSSSSSSGSRTTNPINNDTSIQQNNYSQNSSQDSLDLTQNNNQTKEIQQKNLFSTITGAITGTFGTVGTIFVLIFLIFIIGAFITVHTIRARRRKK